MTVSCAVRVLLAFTLLLASLCPAAAIIKASQLGDADWLQKFVGRISLARFAANSRPRAYVATESNVVACLNLRNGHIIWRQVLDATKDAVDELVVVDHPASAVITLSGGGFNLRAWSPSGGSLLWEHSLATPYDRLPAGKAYPGAETAASDATSGSNSDEVAAFAEIAAASELGSTPDLLAGSSRSTAVFLQEGDSSTLPLLVVFSFGRIWGFRLAAAGGVTLEWHVSLLGWLHAAAVEVVANQAGVHVVGLLSGGAQLGVAHVIVRGTSARVGKNVRLPALQLLKAPLILWASDGEPMAVAALTASAEQLCSADVTDGEALACHHMPTESAASAAVSEAKLLPIIVPSRALVLQGGSAAVLLHRGASGDYTAAATFPGATAASVVVPSGAGAVVALGGRRGRAVWTAILNASDALQVVSEEAAENVSSDANDVSIPVEALFLGSFPRKDGTSGFRVITTLADATVALLQQGICVWSRPEALATIVRARFADLPASATSYTGGGAAAPSIQERFRVQMLSFKESVQLAQPQELTELREFREAHSSKHLPLSDANGFRRMLLVLTSSGTLAALHCGSGRVMWSVWFGAVSRRSAASVHLLPWRSSHDMHKAPQVLVLLPQPGDSGTIAAAVNVHTGEVGMQRTLLNPVQQVVKVPRPVREGSEDQHVYLLVSPSEASGGGRGAGEEEALSVQVLPAGPAAVAAAEVSAPTLHFWQASLATGVVTGWGFSNTQPGASLTPQLRWSSVRSAMSPALLAIVARGPQEPLQSSAKVLGDRSLKVKHLNRHVVLLASGSTPGRPSPAGEAPPQLAIELVDSVTGKFLFRQTHQGCHGPVHGVIAEHWAVYSFWNALERRHQVAVVELYEEAQVDRLQLLFGSSNRTASSYRPPQLEVLQSSWYWGAGVTAAAATTTARGIATKSLLFGTSTGQVYLMDKRFLDPRRPLKSMKEMSASEQGERLLPQAPLLPLMPSSYATLSYRVAGLKGVVTAPAVMESATHMVAHGIDVMYIRLSPAASFDGLAADFPFALLVVLVATMTAASLILRRFAVRRDVKGKWE